jgi:hypothetical protein
MELIERAAAVLSEAESALRRLMADGLESQMYAVVARIAGLTEQVAQLRGDLTGFDDPVQGPAPAKSNGGRRAASSPSGLAASHSGRHSSSPLTTERAKYPRFERDGDKLVKIGWSDRDQRIYEHRAPKAVVVGVCEALSRRSARGRRFKMEEVLPELNDLKESVPSYQGYLTLAWLRSEGVIDRDGKDGYRVKSGSLSVERIEELWESLSERSPR